MDQPVALIAKTVNEEGGMGILARRNVMHGARWLLQKKLDKCEAAQRLLPDRAPLSTMRVENDCRNDVVSGEGSGDSVEKQHLLSAQTWLCDERAFVWVYEAHDVQQVMTAPLRHRWKLGDVRGVCAGTVIWLSRKRVVRVASGGYVLARDAVDGEAEHAPWLQSSVG
eukprot:6717087-Pyramimonas_sp.AAC.1